MSTLGYTFGEELYRDDQYALHRGTRSRDDTPVLIKSALIRDPREVARLQRELATTRAAGSGAALEAYDLVELEDGVALILEDFGGELLSGLHWPGNVRELENVVERALILSPGETLRLEESFGGGQTPPGSPSSGKPSGKPERLVDLELAHIRSVLEACGWKIKGRGNAAERLGIKPPTLRGRMKKLGIVRPGS